MRQESFMPASYKIQNATGQERQSVRSRSGSNKRSRPSNPDKYSYSSQKDITKKAAKLHRQGIL